jgi:transcriptional regulator with PAS, ATPase and Fis domain
VAAAHRNAGVSPDSLRHNREDNERVVIQQVLEKHNFSRARAAAALGISRVTLYKKMKKYGLMGLSV